MADIRIYKKGTKEPIKTVSTMLQAYREIARQYEQTFGKVYFLKKEKKSKIINNINKVKLIIEVKKKAWNWFSKYIRLKYADTKGNVQCVTCGKYYKWNGGIQAGHYVDGRKNAVLLNEKIVYPQCTHCNIFLHGNKNKYTEFMKELGYTDNELKFFENLKKQPCKKSLQLWEWELNKYKNLALQEAEQRGIKL